MEAEIVEFPDAFPFFVREEGIAINTGLIVPREVLEEMEDPVGDIVETIRNEKIDFPFKRFTLSIEEADKMFIAAKEHKAEWGTLQYSLKGFDDDPLFPPIFHPITFTPNDSDDFRDNNDLIAIGSQKPIYVLDNKSSSLYWEVNVITDFFVEPSRVKGYRTGNSIYNAWFHDEHFLKTVVTEAIKEHGEITPHTLREAIYSARVFQECPHERVTFTVDMFRMLTSHIDGIPLIFDPCGGYGDRLLAAMCMEADYVGVEPNSDSHYGFREMIERYGNDDTEKYNMLNDYMPTASLPVNLISQGADLSMISPPSFDSEKYSEDEGQSIAIYPERDTWLVKFLFQTIHRTWTLLKYNRYLIIQSILAKEINAYIRMRFPDAIFIGAITVNNNCRYKPMWIWLKTLDFKQQDLIGSKITNKSQYESRFSKQVLESIKNGEDTTY